MQIKEAEFVISNTDYRKCPKTDVPEFAFIGRSNVGKSSLINMLCGNKALAKTSSQPGKTQCINHFSINKNTMYWVDLPGYGYARTSKESREKWRKMTYDYLE
ncbi:MAG: ribosome biogenesis GTP-binding protein YihA/YsxC, partial [Bacteroidales bacterium]|nr:ribosome biogenesis GTP-binding protein YihA/YsxC [Bacteroidales bacterium]